MVWNQKAAAAFSRSMTAPAAEIAIIRETSSQLVVVLVVIVRSLFLWNLGLLWRETGLQSVYFSRSYMLNIHKNTPMRYTGNPLPLVGFFRECRGVVRQPRGGTLDNPTGCPP